MTSGRVLAFSGGVGGAKLSVGDGYLALHIERTRRLREGESLTETTDATRWALGTAVEVLPMTDDAVQTRLLTEDGWLAFQEFFVRYRCQLSVIDFDFAGSDVAYPNGRSLAATNSPDLRAVIICHPVPWLSIDPIYSMPALRQALRRGRAPRLAVSPISERQSSKGPTAKVMNEIGIEGEATSVARYFAGHIDAFIFGEIHAGATIPPGIRRFVTPAPMRSFEEKKSLATAVPLAADHVARVASAEECPE